METVHVLHRQGRDIIPPNNDMSLKDADSEQLEVNEVPGNVELAQDAPVDSQKVCMIVYVRST